MLYFNDVNNRIFFNIVAANELKIIRFLSIIVTITTGYFQKLSIEYQ